MRDRETYLYAGLNSLKKLSKELYTRKHITCILFVKAENIFVEMQCPRRSDAIRIKSEPKLFGVRHCLYDKKLYGVGVRVRSMGIVPGSVSACR